MWPETHDFGVRWSPGAQHPQIQEPRYPSPRPPLWQIRTGLRRCRRLWDASLFSSLAAPLEGRGTDGLMVFFSAPLWEQNPRLLLLLPMPSGSGSWARSCRRRRCMGSLYGTAAAAATAIGALTDSLIFVIRGLGVFMPPASCAAGQGAGARTIRRSCFSNKLKSSWRVPLLFPLSRFPLPMTCPWRFCPLAVMFACAPCSVTQEFRGDMCWTQLRQDTSCEPTDISCQQFHQHRRRTHLSKLGRCVCSQTAPNGNRPPQNR